ncbi:conserved hypothetical protein [Cenarchaeum symbiosum A]|uniref:Phasin domain-containing protein n=1 Tax=Cenarchaeum symbiosum (strain A) TaxID=414004 RepID=A0RX84_CENSY|nr:conserved hypothetical protein [Cenarchaeum symbiosum A]
MSTGTEHGPKDVHDVYQQNVDRFMEAVKQSVLKYHQSVTNAQKEYVDACENVINPAITLHREFAKKTGMVMNVPDASLRLIHDTTEEAVKAASIGNQIALTAIDAAQQNVRTFNDNAKAFTDLNKNILHSWISAFAPGRQG